MNQPVGPAVDTTPAERPGTATLSGRFCRIEPLDPVRHGEDLWREFAGDETLWTYFSNGPFANERGFAEWLERRAALADPFSYVVVYLNDGRSAGYFALLEIRPTMRVIEIGSIVYGPVLQRTPAATEAQYLMARYAFETLRYRRYEWKCDALNAKSRRAALRLGFTFEAIFVSTGSSRGATGIAPGWQFLMASGRHESGHSSAGSRRRISTPPVVSWSACHH